MPARTVDFEENVIMQISQVEFQFKGSRDYIQGPDLFNGMLPDDYPIESLHNIRFIAHQFVRSPSCRLYRTTDRNELSSIPEISARCQFDFDRTTHWLALEVCADGKQGGRCEYDEASIIALCTVAGKAIELNGTSPYSFIETLVSMNKYLHQRLFPEAEGKWIFTRVDLNIGSDQHDRLQLRFKHNMNFRLTKSEILVNGQSLGDLYFSLVKP